MEGCRSERRADRYRERRSIRATLRWMLSFASLSMRVVQRHHQRVPCVSSSRSDDLTLQQLEAITALLSKKTIAQAAKVVKVSDRTLYRWLEEPAFAREFRRAKKRMLEHSLTALNKLAAKAIETLGKNLTTRGEHSVQVRAAKVILDKAINGQALVDLQAELDELRAERMNANHSRVESRSQEGAGGVPEEVRSAQPDAGPPPSGSDAPLPGDGMDAGPVAGAVPAEPVEEGIPPLFPPGREDDGDGQPGDDGSEPTPEE